MLPGLVINPGACGGRLRRASHDLHAWHGQTEASGHGPHQAMFCPWSTNSRPNMGSQATWMLYGFAGGACGGPAVDLQTQLGVHVGVAGWLCRGCAIPGPYACTHPDHGNTHYCMCFGTSTAPLPLVVAATGGNMHAVLMGTLHMACQSRAKPAPASSHSCQPQNVLI